MCFRAWSASTSILFPHLERIVCVLVAIWLNSPFVIGNPFAWSFLAIRYGVSKNKDPRDPCVVRCLQCFQDLGDPILWINRYPVKTNSSDTVCTSIIGWDSWSSTPSRQNSRRSDASNRGNAMMTAARFGNHEVVPLLAAGPGGWYPQLLWLVCLGKTGWCLCWLLVGWTVEIQANT